MTDAFAIPFQEFDRMRQYLEEKELGPEFMGSPLAEPILKMRQQMESIYRRAYYGE